MVNRYGARGRDRVVRLTTQIPKKKKIYLVQSERALLTNAEGHNSDYNGTNTKLSKIMLNGNHICMVVQIPVLPKPPLLWD